MREIMTNKDIGTTIDFRSQAAYEALHPWPADTVVSAGAGIVFVRNPKPGARTSYTTLFMEVYPPGAAFIRGEGETAEACEHAAWVKYMLALNCSDASGSHDWEARGYHNGAGFCSRCNTFGSQVFTGEQLGQFCEICHVGTTYHWGTDEHGDPEYLCEEHLAPRPELDLPDLLSETFGQHLDAILTSLTTPAADGGATNTVPDAPQKEA